MASGLTADEMVPLWEEHINYELETRNTEDTLETMVEDAYVNHIPTLTGGYGKSQHGEFYSQNFIPKMPADTGMVSVSRTAGADQLVNEKTSSFTNDMQMDWMLLGVAPTD